MPMPLKYKINKSLALAAMTLCFSGAAIAVDSSKLDDTESKVEAIGIVGFSFKYVGEEYPQVGNLLAEGPAAKLDIKTGDRLLAIDGQDTALLSISRSRALLTGKPGTPVTIKLKRGDKVFEQVLERMPSTEVKDHRLRNMIEHYRSRQNIEADAPLLLCQFCEPGPSVVEFSSGERNKLLAAKEKEGLSVKHVDLDDAKSAKLVTALGLTAKSPPLYYFAGILTAQGVLEKRPLTAEILAANLKQINWLPGQDSLNKSMIEQYETLRKQSWQPSANADSLSNSSEYKSSREAATKAVRQYINLHNSGSDHAAAMRAMLAPEAVSFGLPPMGKLLFEQSEAEPNVLVVGNNYAVARTRLNDPKPLDVYFYLRRDTNWKITALRALACNGPLGAIADQLRKKKASGSLNADEHQTLQNLEITLATDKDLKTWFKQNQSALEQLAQSGSQLSPGTSILVNDHRQPHEISENLVVKEKLKVLHLSSLNKVDEKQIEIIIGGVTDNTVGFLYAPDNKPPLLGPSEYIWVEKVADKWYLFRTT